MLPWFHKLTDAKAKKAPAGRHSAGYGLWLCRPDQGDTVWEMCLNLRGEQHNLQIGTYPALSVKSAQAEAKKWRGLARRGLDPAAQQEAFRDAAARNLHQFYC
ncbi:MAG: Arm DNA-binding domain-containing protein [Sulfitobacter sp.]